MYPQRELNLLAARKDMLRQRIALTRIQTCADLARVVQPVAWCDKVVAFWKRIPPLTKLVAIPLGLLVVKRTIFPQRKIKILGSLLRWGVTAFGVRKGVGNAKKPIERTARY
jgi:hypothetical protein